MRLSLGRIEEGRVLSRRATAQTFDFATQKDALEALAKLCARSVMEDPIVRQTALKITRECASRDDQCEVNAIFEAVKNGHPSVRGMEHGLRYVTDPIITDYFVRPGRLLQNLRRGYNGEDCDGHAALLAALLCSIGFVVGLRAYAKPKNPGEYVHVYAVVGLPKKDPTEFIGLDTTVEQSYAGWEPPKGRVLTAYIR